jgi:hypothetical protein
MANEPHAKPSVVVDQPLAETLLYLAVEERLVDDRPEIGDGYVRRLMQRRRPDESLIQTAFEQLMLGGSVVVPFWMPAPSQWKGRLFEEGTVLTLKSPPLDEELLAGAQ